MLRHVSRSLKPIPVAALDVTLAVLLLAVVSYFQFDQPIAVEMRPWSGLPRQLAEWLSEVGESQYWLVPAAVIAGLAVWRKRYQLAGQALFFFASLAGAGVLNNAFKVLFGRWRPKQFFIDGSYGFTYFKVGYIHNSFPSGHSAVAGALAAWAWRTLPAAYRNAIVLLTVGIAASRVVLTAHWLSDVLVGYTLGVWFTVLLARRLSEARPRGASAGHDLNTSVRAN